MLCARDAHDGRDRGGRCDRDRPGGAAARLRRGRPARRLCHRGAAGRAAGGRHRQYGAAGGHARALCGLVRGPAGQPRKRRQLCVFQCLRPARAGLCERVFRARPAAHGALYAGRLCGGRAAWPRAWRPACSSAAATRSLWKSCWPRWGRRAPARRTNTSSSPTRSNR